MSVHEPAADCWQPDSTAEYVQLRTVEPFYCQMSGQPHHQLQHVPAPAGLSAGSKDYPRQMMHMPRQATASHSACILQRRHCMPPMYRHGGLSSWYMQGSGSAWSSRRGRQSSVSTPPPGLPADHQHMSCISPPALTRCVSTVPSPLFSTQSQQPGDVKDSAMTDRPQLDRLCHELASRAGHSRMPSLSSSCCCCVPLQHSSAICDQTRVLPHVDHVCQSLVDRSQKPDTANQAACMYIDYLIRDNERVSGEIGPAGDASSDQARQTVMSIMLNDDSYRDLVCKPVSVPTPRFRDWLKTHDLQLEMADSLGGTVSQKTMRGCCTMPLGDVTNVPASAVVFTPPPAQAQSSGYHQPVLMYPAGRIYRPGARVAASHRASGRQLSAGVLPPSVPGRGRPRGRGLSRGRGRGRGRGRPRGSQRSAASRSSLSDRCSQSPSPGRRCLPSKSSASGASLLDVDGDSAAVEILATLQSDAARRRRCHQQQELYHYQQQQQYLSDGGGSVAEFQTDAVIVEEIASDESHLINLGSPLVPPQSQPAATTTACSTAFQQLHSADILGTIKPDATMVKCDQGQDANSGGQSASMLSLVSSVLLEAQLSLISEQQATCKEDVGGVAAAAKPDDDRKAHAAAVHEAVSDVNASVIAAPIEILPKSYSELNPVRDQHVAAAGDAWSRDDGAWTKNESVNSTQLQQQYQRSDDCSSPLLNVDD